MPPCAMWATPAFAAFFLGEPDALAVLTIATSSVQT